MNLCRGMNALLCEGRNRKPSLPRECVLCKETEHGRLLQRPADEEESMRNSASAYPVLVVTQLSKRFRHGNEAVEAVKEVSLSLERGDFVAVMGASGSGKSTLLHLIAGLTAPDEGTVTIAGSDIFAMRDHERTVFRRREVGLIFQAFNLIPSLSAEENIALPLLLGDGKDGKQGKERVERLISRLGLVGVRSRRPDAMSGGEQQRVAIGRALVTRPSLILADEPTGSLDSVNGRKLCENFAELCHEDGAAVLMVTHNPTVAFHAEKVVVLHDGRVAHQCRTKDYGTVQEFTCDCIERTQALEGAVQ